MLVLCFWLQKVLLEQWKWNQANTLLICTVVPFFFGMDPHTYVLRMCYYISLIMVLVLMMTCDTICLSHVERVLIIVSFIPSYWRFIPSHWRLFSLPCIQDPSVQHCTGQYIQLCHLYQLKQWSGSRSHIYCNNYHGRGRY